MKFCGGALRRHSDTRPLINHGRAQLGRECYPGGNCVASELGKEQTVGQIKMLAMVSFVFVLYRIRLCVVCVVRRRCAPPHHGFVFYRTLILMAPLFFIPLLMLKVRSFCPLSYFKRKEQVLGGCLPSLSA